MRENQLVGEWGDASQASNEADVHHGEQRGQLRPFGFGFRPERKTAQTRKTQNRPPPRKRQRPPAQKQKLVVGVLRLLELLQAAAVV